MGITKTHNSLNEFVQNFINTPYFNIILNTLNVDYFSSSQEDCVFLYSKINYNLTPREKEIKRIFNIDIIFYLDKLYNNNLFTYHDMGCGGNIFKKIFFDKGTTIGYDPYHTEADCKCTFDQFYDNCITNNQKIDRFYAINSIHYCGEENIETQLNKILSIMNVGGMSLVTLNTMVLLYNNESVVPEYSRLSIDQKNNDIQRVMNHIDKFLMNNKNVSVIHKDSIKTNYVNHLNGNIIFLFEKTCDV